MKKYFPVGKPFTTYVWVEPSNDGSFLYCTDDDGDEYRTETEEEAKRPDLWEDLCLNYNPKEIMLIKETREIVIKGSKSPK